MSRCFGGTSSKLSAKDYIYKKRNKEIFCDLRGKYLKVFKATGNNVACLDSGGVIVKYVNNSALLNLTSAFEDFRTDLSNAYVGQQSHDAFCEPYYPPTSNVDVTNNYDTNAYMLTLAGTGNTAQDFIVDSSGTYINRYAELDSSTPSLDASGNFISGKKILYTKCARKTSTRTQVIYASEVPPPLVSSIIIIFV